MRYDEYMIVESTWGQLALQDKCGCLIGYFDRNERSSLEFLCDLLNYKDSLIAGLEK